MVSAAVSGVGTLSETASISVVAATATHLVFTVQPSSTTENAAITPAVEVSALDAFGNVATSFSGAITVSIAAGTGTPLAVLSGTLTVSAVAGTATFSNLSINLLSTTAQSLPTKRGLIGDGVTSATFNVAL